MLHCPPFKQWVARLSQNHRNRPGIKFAKLRLRTNVLYRQTTDRSKKAEGVCKFKTKYRVLYRFTLQFYNLQSTLQLASRKIEKEIQFFTCCDNVRTCYFCVESMLRRGM